jgi:hypothetical protein
MNTELLLKRRTEWLVAEFGHAQLVQASNGRYELRGGALREYQEAKEWCSLFMPDIVIWRV